jgi:caffeoyl-CoA O-methyltransferase
MAHDLFAAIDKYIEELFVGKDDVLDAALRATHAAGMPDIQVSASLGKLLYLLAKLINAQHILEIGTLAGYSAIWLARALPASGKLITLEFDATHAQVARSNLARAGMSERVEVMQGNALDTLPQLAARALPPFDMVFIDADKVSYPRYLDWSIRLTRPGGLIVADNVVRAGAVLQPPQSDEAAQGASQFNALLARDARVEAIVLQQVGIKGHDGIAVARVR